MARRRSEHERLPTHEVETSRLLPPGRAGGGLPKNRSKFVKEPKPLTTEEINSARRARSARRRWEQTPEGQARTSDARTLLQTGMSNSQIYRGSEWDEQTGVGPRHYDRQLPGLEDPNAAPRPPKWEELDPNTRAHIERGLAQHGTSIDQMSSDWGAQLDQAYLRMESYGHTNPAGMDFYEGGLPRRVIDSSARELGVPQSVHAALNAITSPNTTFMVTPKSGPRVGETYFPNNEAAEHAIRHIQQGGTSENISNVRSSVQLPEGVSTAGRLTARPANLVKAARAYEQYLAGKSIKDWRGEPSESNPEGTPMLSSKTGPYANSWSDTHPQFFVADVHSGGAMLPHLSTDKPVMVDSKGNPLLSETGQIRRHKSERERAIEKIPYFHTAADYAARLAMNARGLGSIRDSQATQWHEEQVQRGLVDPDEAYGHTASAPVEDPNQLNLF